MIKKKIVTALFCIGMFFSLSVTAFAAEMNSEETEKYFYKENECLSVNTGDFLSPDEPIENPFAGRYIL